MRFAHVASVENFADILTKPLTNAAFHSLVKPLLFRQPTWKDRKDAVRLIGRCLELNGIA